MAQKIFRAYKDARRYDGWSGEVDPNLGQHEELLYTKVCPRLSGRSRFGLPVKDPWTLRSFTTIFHNDLTQRFFMTILLKSPFRIMITAVQMKMQTLVFSAQKIVRVAQVEKDREKEDRGRRDEVGETEDEIGRKQEGIDEIKKKMIHLKNNCQR